MGGAEAVGSSADTRWSGMGWGCSSGAGATERLRDAATGKRRGDSLPAAAAPADGAEAEVGPAPAPAPAAEVVVEEEEVEAGSAGDEATDSFGVEAPDTSAL